MNRKSTVLALAAIVISVVANVWLAVALSSEKSVVAGQREQIAKLQAETERLDRELWKVPRALDFKKPFGVEPGAPIDEASLAAKFMDTEGGYLGFKPAELVGEKDSKRIAEVSGFVDKTWKTKAEAEKASHALKVWIAYWMADSSFDWKVEIIPPDGEWNWRVKFRVIEKDLAAKIKAREK